jgi:hypothetical protein
MDNNLNNQNNSEEVDLFKLFNFFESKIKSVFRRIFNSLKDVFSFFIFSLKSLIRNIKIILVLLFMAVLTGFYLDYIKPKEYSSEMLVEPYFDAKYQLNSNIQYYNSLIEDYDYKTLSKIFEIDEVKAEKIIAFDMFPGPETDNALRKEYFSFIKEISVKTKGIDGNEKNKTDVVVDQSVLNVSYDDFLEGRSIFSSTKYIIKIVSIDKNIFENLTNGLNTSFNSEFSRKNIGKRNTILGLRKESILKSIKDIDSLQKIYIQVFKENYKSKSNKLKMGDGGLEIADNKVQTREYDLLLKKQQLTKELQLIEEEKVNDDTVFDIISSFPAIGKVDRKPILQKNIVKLPLISFSLFLIGLIFVNTFKFIKEYE